MINNKDKNGKADLHIHTTSSDGVLSPKEVLEWASKKRITAISITDHDTVDGIQSAIDFSKNYSIEVIPGIEFSTELHSEEVHILAYCFDYKNNELLQKLNKIQSSRYLRAIKIIEKLKSIDVRVSFDKVQKYSQNGLIGRPHIARVMIEEGYVNSIKEAFDNYLAKDKIAYVERYKLTCSEAISIIKSLGGIPVLAHPGLLSKKLDLKYILDLGIKGIEVYHSKHNEEDIKKFSIIAKSRNLIITGGSDCHGTSFNNEPLIGNIWVDYSAVNCLKNASKTLDYKKY